MRRIWIGALFLCVCLTSCGGASSPEGEGDASPSGAAGEAVNDTQAMQEATSVANEIIRNAADCEAVEANIESAMSRLNEISSSLQTEVGRTSMNSLLRQVEQIAAACGVG